MCCLVMCRAIIGSKDEKSSGLPLYITMAASACCLAFCTANRVRRRKDPSLMEEENGEILRKVDPHELEDASRRRERPLDG